MLIATQIFDRQTCNPVPVVSVTHITDKTYCTPTSYSKIGRNKHEQFAGQKMQHHLGKITILVDICIVQAILLTVTSKSYHFLNNKISHINQQINSLAD